MMKRYATVWLDSSHTRTPAGKRQHMLPTGGVFAGRPGDASRNHQVSRCLLPVGATNNECCFLCCLFPGSKNAVEVRACVRE